MRLDIIPCSNKKALLTTSPQTLEWAVKLAIRPIHKILRLSILVFSWGTWIRFSVVRPTWRDDFRDTVELQVSESMQLFLIVLGFAAILNIYMFHINMHSIPSAVRLSARIPLVQDLILDDHLISLKSFENADCTKCCFMWQLIWHPKENTYLRRRRT